MIGISSLTIGADEFAAAIEEMASEAVEADRAELSARVKEAGRTSLSVVRDLSPRRTGEYARGWRLEYEADGYGGVSATVHNAAKPGLAHLLEKGHEKFDFHGHDTGERVRTFPHIEPAYEAGRSELA